MVPRVASAAPERALRAREARDAELEAWVAEIRLRARRRVGELTSELERGRGPGRGSKIQLSKGGKFKNDALKEAGLSVAEAHRCEQIAQVPEGEISAALGKSPSGRAALSLPDDGKSKTATLKAAGISTSAANRYEKLAHKDARARGILGRVPQMRHAGFATLARAVICATPHQ